MASQLPPGIDPSTIPLSDPPPGHIPNFENPPDSQAPIVLGTGIAFGIVSLSFVVLRVWTNLSVTKKLSLDDYLCLLAWILATSYFGLSAGVGHLERHSYDIPLSWLDANAVKIYYASNFIVGPQMWAAKSAILALYYRLFYRKTWLRWSCYIGIVVLTLVYWTSPILASIYCAPRLGQPWDLEVILNCENVSVLGPIYGAFAVASDVFLLVLPLPVIFELKMPMGRKIALAAVFMTGIFALIASIAALVYKIEIFRSPDPNWNAASTYACIIVENYLTVIVSCAPAMSSLWINKLSQSTWVSSWRQYMSGTRLWQGTAASKERFGSSGQASINSTTHGMYPLDRNTVIASGPQGSTENKAGIYTSVQIDQSSEASR